LPADPASRQAGYLDARAIGHTERGLTPVRAAGTVELPELHPADEGSPLGCSEAQDRAVRVCAVPDADALSPTQADDDVPAVTGSP